jgi:hypothetical protein
VRCGAVLKEALLGLDKAAKVTSHRQKEGSGLGVYTLSLPRSAKFEYIALEKAIPRRYIVERVDVKLAGEVAKDEKGFWITAPAGNRWMLRNRRKKDENDVPPDVIGKIEEQFKKGVTYFRIAGEATRDRQEVTFVRLDSAEPAEKK